MKKKIFWSLLFSFFIFQKMVAQDIEEFYFKFEISSKSEIEKITQLISIDNVKENIVFAYANRYELNEFQKLGYRIEFIQKNVPKLITMATSVAQMTNWDRYPTYEVYQQMMWKFQKDYPSICKLDSFGTSINGRQLYSIKLSDNVLIDEAEPEFLYTSSMHGDETTGYILMLRLIDSLLISHGTSPDITNLINSTEIFINPLSNPDGTYRGGNHTVSEATRFNANNEDLNRDFPDPRIGPNAPYQPENEAMMNYVSTRNFIMSASFHGLYELMNYPWDAWTSSQNTHPDDAWFRKICTNYVSTARTVRSSYMTDPFSSGISEGGDWYVIIGGRQDYMNFWRKCREVTIEVSSIKLLPTEYLRIYWDINRNSLLNYIKETSLGIRGFVKDYNGNPLRAMIFVNDYDQLSDSSIVYSSNSYGDYYRLLNPGTYSLTASKYGFLSKTIDNIVLEENSLTNIDFILEKDILYSVSGLIINGVTGNPVEDVEISILNAPVEKTTTNSLGMFTLNNITSGTYLIKLKKNEFTVIIDTITIDSENHNFNYSIFPSFIEDFETGDFNRLNWQLSSNTNWTIDSSTIFEGQYSARSGIINNNSISTISFNINITKADFISFNRKVSSEDGYDFLRFYIDDVEKNKWSGNLDWEEFSYSVNSGIHNLKWVYSKDESIASGSDCAWIDYISLPITNSDTSLFINLAQITDTLSQPDSVIYELVIHNTNSYSNNYNVTIENESLNSWLTVNKKDGIINELSADTIMVTLRNEFLEPGNYNTTITITESDNDKHSIPVNLFVPVNPDTSLVITPEIIEDTLISGESAVHKLILYNSGTVKNKYGILYSTEGCDWYNINKTTDTIEVKSYDTLLVILNNVALFPGNYSCNINIIEEDGDIYLVPVHLYVPVIGISEELIDNIEVKLYPNPFEDYLTFELFDQIKGDILFQIYNAIGRKILQKKYNFTGNGKRYFTIDGLDNLEKGIYIVKIITNNKNYSVRIVKL